MSSNKSKRGPLVYDAVSNFRKGLDMQRELFKSSRAGGTPNFDQMCDAIENIKSEMKGKLIKSGQKDLVLRVERIIDWYRRKEEMYSKMTPEGPQVVFPPDILYTCNKNLTIAYELLVKSMDDLELL